MHKSLKMVLASIILMTLCAGFSIAQTTDKKELTQDQRMAWWKDAKFGMFIHWGIYSVAGGEWKGKDYGKEASGRSAEWIMNTAKISKEDYATLAQQFNPTQFDAQQWVTIAKNAGMKYMVITAKHHDGFSMYDSKVTDFDIMDATPYKKDVIDALAKECAKQGLKFGVYYSHEKDWHNNATPNKEKEYVPFVKDQLTELLTNYGPISVLWFDLGATNKNDIYKQYKDLVRKLQPQTIISGRITKATEKLGDYESTPDRTLVSGKMNNDFETPMTLRDNWAFDKNENNWKSVKDVLTILTLTTCRGGNLLLNVGPSPQGTIVKEDVERLAEVGKWLSVNGDAIYGTHAGPFDYDFPWGTVSAKDGKLYLFIMQWDANGIELNGLKSKVQKAYFLSKKSDNLNINQDVEKGYLKIEMPQEQPTQEIPVIALEIKDKLVIDDTVKGKYFWNPNFKAQKDKEREAKAGNPEKSQKPKNLRKNKKNSAKN